MGIASRRQLLPLIEELKADPYKFDLFRIIEFFDKRGTLIGTGNDPLKEALHIYFKTSLAVHSSPVAGVDLELEKKTIWVNVYGLTGTFGPLPTPYSEMLLERIRAKDFAMRRFLDVFHHRLMSLRHLIEKKYSLGLFQVPQEKSPVGSVIDSIVGYLNKSEEPHSFRSLVMTYHDSFWRRQRSVAGFAKILEGFFKGIRVKVIQLQGDWRVSREADRSLLGKRFVNIGRDMILGSRSWDQMAGLLLDLGTIYFEAFEKLVVSPHGVRGVLKKLCLLYFSSTLSIRLKCRIDDRSMPPLRFDRKRRLGFETWLRSPTMPNVLKPPTYTTEI